MDKSKKGKLNNYNYKEESSLRKTGLISTVDTLQRPHYHFRMQQSVKAYKQMEDYITRLWAKRGITWN